MVKPGVLPHLMVWTFLLASPATDAVAQVDTTRREFFPLHVGDLWQYRNEDYKLAIEQVVGDTIIEGRRYFNRVNSLRVSGPVVRVDSALRVQRLYDIPIGGGSCGGESLRERSFYRLGELDSSIWRVCDEFYGWPTETPLVRFDGVFFRRIFGQVREVMDFSFGGVSFETGDTSFGYGATLVRGIGIYHEQYYDSPFFQLYGAIINGVQYGTIVSVDQIAAPLPGQVALQQNFPNPFNPTTTIRYELPEHLRAKLSIYNVLGQEITTLVDELQAGGRYEVLFSGGGLPSGLYVCVLYAGEFRASRRILLIK